MQSFEKNTSFFNNLTNLTNVLYFDMTLKLTGSSKDFYLVKVKKFSA